MTGGWVDTTNKPSIHLPTDTDERTNDHKNNQPTIHPSISPAHPHPSAAWWKTHKPSIHPSPLPTCPHARTLLQLPGGGLRAPARRGGPRHGRGPRMAIPVTNTALAVFVFSLGG